MKAQIKNLEAFNKLIDRYESITEEEIRGDGIRRFVDYNVKTDLTGFGNSDDCTLCQVTGYSGAIMNWENCAYCVYSATEPNAELESRPCIRGKNRRTFYGILHADTPKQLLKAYRNRAKHMRKILKTLNLE